MIREIHRNNPYDRNRKSVIYNSIGVINYNLGNYPKAIEFFEKSLKIAKELKDKKGEADCYANLGLVYYSLADYTLSNSYTQSALIILIQLHDKTGESRCNNNLGLVYYGLGNYPKAIEFFEKSLKIAKELKDKKGESDCCTNLGNAYHRLIDNTKSIEYHIRALKIDEKIGNKYGQSKCYGNIGLVYAYGLSNYPKAIEFFEKSLKIAKELKDKTEELRSYINLGPIYYYLGQYTKTINYSNAALEIAKETGDIPSEALIDLNLARCYYNMNKNHDYLEMAYVCCGRSIGLSEAIGGKVVEEEYKIGFYSLKYTSYQLMIEICLALIKDHEALNYVERSKSRALLDMLSSSAEIKPSSTLKKRYPALIKKEEELRNTLTEIQTKYLKISSRNKERMGLTELNTGTSNPIAKIDPAHLTKTLSELNKIYHIFYEIDKKYVDLKTGRPLDFFSTQSIL